jgi:WD40 repeat protein
VYRSEDGEGGLFVVPALGGEGLARKIASFGYYPRWSPDSSQILFQRNVWITYDTDGFYVVALDGDALREVFANFISHQNLRALSAPWHPDGNKISIWGWDPGNTATLRSFWTVSLAGGVAVRSEEAPEILRQLEEVSAGHRFESGWDVKFSWAPSGKAIYFERIFKKREESLEDDCRSTYVTSDRDRAPDHRTRA